MLPQSAVTEQWIRVTFAGAQYVVNAPQKFAQTVLTERNRQVLVFVKYYGFVNNSLIINYFLFNAAGIQNHWFMFGKFALLTLLCSY